MEKLIIPSIALIALLFSPMAFSQSAKSPGDKVVEQYLNAVNRERALIQSMREKIINHTAPGCKSTLPSSECLRLTIQSTTAQTPAAITEFFSIVPDCANKDLKSSRLNQAQNLIAMADIALFVFERFNLSRSWMGQFKPSRPEEKEALLILKQKEIELLTLVRDQIITFVRNSAVKWAQISLNVPKSAEKSRQSQKLHEILNRLEAVKNMNLSY